MLTATRGIFASCMTIALASGCSSGGDLVEADPATTAAASTAAASTAAPETSATHTPSGPDESSTSTEVPTGGQPGSRVAFSADAAMHTIRFLAGTIGPREASSAAYRRAARWVELRFEGEGYDVARQRFRVPAGNSWGVNVPAGVSWNVVATPPGLDVREPHLVVGAHLDTVPQAPGAEDNASGVAVVLGLAALAAEARTRLPVVFVAFGAEEPRGEGDDFHHFGSTAMVARLTLRPRRAVVGMVALDRVGVGSVVPVCVGGLGSRGVQRAVRRAAERVDVPTLACVNTSSDHWSFEKAGMRAARVGGTSYAAYHSAADIPSVVDQIQLGQVGRTLWEWLRA